MKIVFFHRAPSKIHFSIESLFEFIRTSLDNSNFKPYIWTSLWPSQGIVSRLKMIFDARKNQGDINHITGDIHFIALGLKKKKTILTIHDLGILNNTKNFFYRWILKTFWITLPARRVTKITVVSEATKKDLLKIVNIPSSKIRVIGNFINKSFAPSKKKFNNISPGILHIGSAYNKNLDRLIESLNGLNCKLTIIGYPSKHQKKRLIELNINHEILANLSKTELIQQYQKTDILSFISLLEGFGLPILEAQATGRPVITSNISSMPEVAGDAACYVNPYDVKSIRQGIQKVINDFQYRESLIKKGFENVKRFSLENVVKQYEKLYQEVYESSKKKTKKTNN
jgi:glycosyltransferase involved in cell wall biosynthesis